MLESNLWRLADLIQDRVGHNKIHPKELENVTSLLIADGEFDSLPSHIQDAIYFIDMYEIENPSTKQLIESAEKMKEFLKK